MGRFTSEILRGFEFGERVGKGSHSAVYQARHIESGTIVAIKVLHSSFLRNNQLIDRFEAEAEVILRLGEHPYIVDVYDYWRDRNGAFLVLQWLPNGTLRHKLDRFGPPPLKRTLRLMEQLTSGLAAAHDRGIIHRDLKPTNILFDEHNRAHITDFGIAKRMDVDMTAPGTLLGSPAYLAPEQLNGEAISPQTDIYAMGINLFEILHGAHPYVGEKTHTVLLKKMTQSLPSIHALHPHIPIAVDRVIQLATANEPNQRYSNIARMMDDFHLAVSSAGRI